MVLPAKVWEDFQKKASHEGTKTILGKKLWRGCSKLEDK